MSMMSIFTALIFLSLNFMLMNHPLAMGLTLMIQCFLVALFTGIHMPTFWFSYILFLVFLGGLMVLFIYVTSLASNEMFSIKFINMLLMTLIFMMFLSTYIVFDPWFNPDLNYFNNFNKLNFYIMSLMLFKLYNYPISLLTLFLIFYLLLTLVAVVNITKFLAGPLRTLN